MTELQPKIEILVPSYHLPLFKSPYEKLHEDECVCRQNLS